MALRQIRIGSSANIVQYDDADFDSAVETTEPMKAGTPVDANDVLRLGDLTTIMLPPTTVANIDNPTELNSIAGTSGVLIVAHGVNPATGLDTYTIYAYDASGPAVNSPYVVDAAGAGDERWIAIAGKYCISTNILSRIYFRDSGIYIWSSADGWLNLVADVGVEINAPIVNVAELYSAGPITIDAVEDWRYAAAIADDGTKTLPTILANYAAKVEVIISSVGVINANAIFMIDSTGTVTPQIDSGNVVYNVDTDVKLCIGTAAAQNPLTIKYRLGSAVAKIMITMKYVKA